MNDREAYEFYADPEHLRIAGPGRKRKSARLSSMASVRFAPETIEAVKDVAHTEGITAGAWIRRLVTNALRPRKPEPVLVAWPAWGVAWNTTMGSGASFRCAHMSIGNVASASCGTCGPLQRAA